MTHEAIPNTLRAIRVVDPCRRVRVAPARMAYVPERLPPVELPRLHFVEPGSGAWRLAHRQVLIQARELAVQAEPRSMVANVLRNVAGLPPGPVRGRFGAG